MVKETGILVNKPNLLGTHSDIYSANNFSFYMTHQFHSISGINICRKKNLDIKARGKDEDLSLYENALCGSEPMFEVDYQMISPWHQRSGRFPFPSGDAVRDGQQLPEDQ